MEEAAQPLPLRRAAGTERFAHAETSPSSAGLQAPGRAQAAQALARGAQEDGGELGPSTELCTEPGANVPVSLGHTVPRAREERGARRSCSSARWRCPGLCNPNLKHFGNPNGTPGVWGRGPLGGQLRRPEEQEPRWGSCPRGRAGRGAGLWFSCLIGAAGVIATAVRERRRTAQRPCTCPSARSGLTRELGTPGQCCRGHSGAGTGTPKQPPASSSTGCAQKPFGVQGGDAASP